MTIGNGAVIGAGSVVTSDIKPGWAAYGVPARHQRSLVDVPPEQVTGHFETLQEALNDGGVASAFISDQLPRARHSPAELWEKQAPQSSLLVPEGSSNPRRLIIALTVSVAFCMFLVGLLVGSKRIVISLGSGHGNDSL